MNKLFELIKKNWNDILKPVVVLLAICIVIPLALAVTDSVTRDKIAELEIKNSMAAMQSLIKADEYVETEVEGKDSFVYHKAVKDGNSIGYIFSTKAKGYGGEVSVMTAIDTNGVVLSVAILDVSNETPGLGQNAAKESFYSQFTGKKEGIILLKNGANAANNEIDAVTGATITSRAVTNAVNEALEQFKTVFSEVDQAIEGTESEVTASEEQ